MSTKITNKRTLEGEDVAAQSPPKVAKGPDFSTIVKERVLEELCFEEIVSGYFDGVMEDFVGELSKNERRKFINGLPSLVERVFKSTILNEKNEFSEPYEGDVHDCIYNAYSDGFDDYMDEVFNEYPNDKGAIVDALIEEVSGPVCNMFKEMVEEAEN